MKKILSVALAILLVLSTAVLFTGCKTEKTPLEMFKLGSEKLTGALEGKTPAAFAGVDDFNKMTMSAGGIDIAGMLGLEESLEASVDLGASILDGGNVIVDLGLGLGEDKVSAKAELKDGTMYVSVPDASEYFMYTTDTEDLSINVPDTTKYEEDFAKVLEEFGAKYVTEENITAETVDVTVFGEEIKGANKVTLNLNDAAIKELMEKLGGIVTALQEEADGEDYDEIEVGEDVTLSGSLSYVFVDEELKQVILDVKGSDSESVKITADTSISDTAFEIKGSIALAFEDETQEYPFAIKQSMADGKIDGSVNFEMVDPFGDIPEEGEEAADERMSASVTYTGTYTDTTIEADYNGSVKMAGVSVELPFKMTATAEEGKYTYVMDIDTKIMDYDIDTTITIVTEKVEDLKSGEYDMTKGADMYAEEPTDAAISFSTDLMTYLSEFESLEPIVSMLMFGGEDFGGDLDEDFGGDLDEDFGDYDDFSTPLFEISSGDEEYISFNDDGTATMYTYHEVEVDDKAGTFTIMNGEDAIVITFVPEEPYADINGVTYNYEYVDLEYTSWYEFTTEAEGSNVYFEVNFYDDADPDAYIYMDVEYEMDDTTITIDYLDGSDPITIEYTLDEDAGTMTVGDVVYDYYSYDFEY